MKNLIALLISGALVVSGYSQTRNVLVGTNNAVVQPTNFWSADVTNARSGLGLGTAATNPASAFQPSSAVLSNLATGNGTDLTNITATIVGTNISITNVSGLQSALDSKLATNGNTTGTASNVTGVVALANGGTGTTNAASARTSLGATTVGGNIFTLANPDEIRFLRLNANSSVSALTAADFRTAIGVSTGLGTVTSVGMTVPSILSLSTPAITSSGTFGLTLANQTSRHAFLAPNGGGVPSFRSVESDDLPSLAISKITGLQTALDGKLSTTGTAALATNVTGIVALANGGTGSTNTSDARTALGLGTAATNPASAFQASSANLTNLAANNGGGLTNLTATNIVGIIPSSNISTINFSSLGGTLTIASGGTGATNAANARQNLGSTTVGDALFISTNAASARISLGATTVGANLFSLVNPDDIRFIRLNANNSVSALSAADMRTALSVGTNLGTVTSVGMTVPTIFSLSTPTITSSGTFALTLANQSSRHAFLAPNGGGVPAFRALDSDDLPALAIAKITGLQTALDGKLATSGTATLATNVTGIVALANGGTGANSAATARTSLGATTVGGNIFTLANPSAIRFLRLNADNTATALSDSDFRTAIGLGTAATNPATAFQPSSSVLTNLAANNGSSLTNIPVAGVVGALATNGNGAGLTNLTAANITGTVGLASNVTGTIAISNGGSGATTAGGARTNLELGATNAVQFQSLSIGGAGASFTESSGAAGIGWQGVSNRITFSGSGVTLTTNNMAFAFGAGNTNGAAISRTNLGLPLAALTNTTVASFRSALNLDTTNDVVFRSLAVTNTLDQLVAKFEGGNGNPLEIYTTDEGLESGYGGSNYAIGVGGGGFQIKYSPSQSDWGNPVIVDGSGSVVRPTNFWQVAPITTTFIESQPTTNQTTNIAAGRNLHIHSIAPSTVGITNTIALPTTNSFNGDIALVVHQGPTSSVTAVRQAGAATNLITLNQFEEAVEFVYYNSVWQFNHNRSFIEPIFFSGTNAALYAAASRTNLGLGATNDVSFNTVEVDTFFVTGTNALTVPSLFVQSGAVDFNEATGATATRTNLGLGLPALTNTNNANFQAAVFNTNTTPVGSAFNTIVAWMEVHVFTNGSNTSFRVPLFK